MAQSVNVGITIIILPRFVQKWQDMTWKIAFRMRQGNLPKSSAALCTSLKKTWAESVLNRLGYTRRKGTKAARTKPKDFDKTKQEYIDRIEKCVEEHNIPDDLIFNWDQTGVNLTRW